MYQYPEYHFIFKDNYPNPINSSWSKGFYSGFIGNCENTLWNKGHGKEDFNSIKIMTCPHHIFVARENNVQIP